MRAEEILAAEDSLDLSKLSQIEVSIKDKLNEIKTLDSEIVALVSDEELDDEIAQGNLYKEQIYAILISIEKATRSLPPPTAAFAVTVNHGSYKCPCYHTV